MTTDEKSLRFRVSVRENRRIAEAVRLISFQRPFDFKAGQCIALSTSPQGPIRYYSIASGEDEDEIEVLFDVVEGGALTPALSRLLSGEELWVSAPFGTFVDDAGEATWIATGTGIAPFISALRSPGGNRNGNKHLLYGARTVDRFYYAKELQDRLGPAVVFCCSRCAAEDVWRDAAAALGRGTFHPARLTGWLREHEADISSSTRYFLCGSAEMVVEVRDILIAGGAGFDRIFSEIYF